MPDRNPAIVFTEHGGPEVLHPAEIDRPEPGPGQVRLRVKAAGVNPFDSKVRSGAFPGLPAAFPAVPGSDVAGVIDAVGPGVTEFAVGDEVLGSAATGSYATYTLASPAKLTRKPAELDWATAAGLPVVATTAYRVLALVGAQPGETVLLDGAAGGVGTLTVQLARHLGLIVIGTAGEANHDYLRELGAIPVSYGPGLVDRVKDIAPLGVDAAIDLSGRGGLPALLTLAGGPDRVVTIADGQAADFGVRASYGGPAEEVPEALAGAVALVAAGKITLPIARTYPLKDAASAHRDSDSGHVRGKLVLLVD
ncbi:MULTISPECIES: NADP-dependent oxidoreductase [unclassified Crossiella]|uniref:NADP-dependent oxidoreductase n=1 Tax=unclassified Crossiella TaxID=2620835 RepID=UPI001FFF0A2B|nr:MULTISPECIES: NADP-dependent oxidoreductase [unclassified Crossiella]MCK2238843.1 NADP-dependent oxidoreductase [Crossiella sp. S99.2]MCK2251587.1 NADP-dependent oxidoreductase [Crossiella sp. S99.1]